MVIKDANEDITAVLIGQGSSQPIGKMIPGRLLGELAHTLGTMQKVDSSVCGFPLKCRMPEEWLLDSGYELEPN